MSDEGERDWDAEFCDLFADDGADGCLDCGEPCPEQWQAGEGVCLTCQGAQGSDDDQGDDQGQDDGDDQAEGFDDSGCPRCGEAWDDEEEGVEIYDEAGELVGVAMDPRCSGCGITMELDELGCFMGYGGAGL